MKQKHTINLFQRKAGTVIGVLGAALTLAVILLAVSNIL